MNCQTGATMDTWVGLIDKEEQDNQKISGKEIWKKMEAAGLKYNWKRWREQAKIELGGEEWSVACDPHEASRLKSSKAV